MHETRARTHTHRLSGVRCAAVADVPPPSAPTPPDHVEEESPFARPKAKGTSSAAANTGGGGSRKSGGNASIVSEKPKGKAIDPKDFFGAAAATKGGKGKGKGKGALDKDTPAAAVAVAAAVKKKAGGIGSFFGKGVLLDFWPGEEEYKVVVVVNVDVDVDVDVDVLCFWLTRLFKCSISCLVFLKLCCFWCSLESSAEYFVPPEVSHF